MFLELAVASVINTQSLIMKNERVAIQLLNSQCPIVAITNVLLKQERRTDPKFAIVTFNGKEIRACWVLGKDEDVLIIDEFGAGGFVPANEFNPVPVI